MKPLLALLLPAAAALGAASCAFEVGAPVHEVTVESDAPGEPLYVDQTPPPPRDEVVIGLSPGPGYVWVGGYWARYHGEWRWVPGCWTLRPRADAVWVAGHWDSRPRGHVWVAGLWR